MSQRPDPNIIVFGETGGGKSSIINTILGIDKAKVASRALGVTFESTLYPVQIDGNTYNLYDTVGLGEYTGGAVDNPSAIRNLYRLVTDLSNSGGVNLLVFVMKQGRLTESILKNYTLFHRGFCDSKVSIMIIVTGCENVQPIMDTWWTENEASFTNAGMLFDGHACVCASKGRKTDTGYLDEDLVRESMAVVKRLVVQYCMSNGWEKPSISWFRQIMGSILDLFRISKVPTIYADLFKCLTSVEALTNSEAANVIEAILDTSQSTPNIIVFGETGAGKSSVITMILGGNEAITKNSQLGLPLQNAVYPVKIDGKTYNLHDTVGLEERSSNANGARAAGNLYRLVAELSNAGGISLLVYVVKSNNRTPEILCKNYNLLHHGFCNSEVPIVVVVTGCENVKPTMDTWWIDNEASFTKVGMSFDGHACVCAHSGRKIYPNYLDEDLVEDSVDVVRQLVVENCRSNGWKRPSIDSPQPSAVNLFRMSKIPYFYRGLYERLRNTFSHPEARKIIEAVRKIAE